MDAELVERLFYEIAKCSMEMGVEMSIEQKNYKDNSNILSGAFSKTERTDSGLILRTYFQSTCDECDECDENEGEEEADDV